MKHFLLLAAALVASLPLQAEEPDSLALRHLDEAVVMSVKAPTDAPYATTRFRQTDLEQFSTTASELPHLFARTPGVISWSENGLGSGTSGMRIRGTGDSRINVTLDGVPLNSPEDQCVFWANTSSYAALLQGIQVQRGVGTSTNGDGAFGGTVALQSRTPSLTPGATLTGSYGSYNTWRAGGSASSGLLFRHLIIEGAYHETHTDGYLHGTQGRAGSYYGALTYLSTSRRLKLSYKNLGNFEHTGQAWNGVEDYPALRRLGLGRFNNLYEAFNAPADPALGTHRFLLADGSLWPGAADVFRQNHSLLNLSATLSPLWTLSATAHYTHGQGYYDEFKPACSLAKFGISAAEPSDLVRQKGVRQDVGGIVAHAAYRSGRWEGLLGGSAQVFGARHFGHLTYLADPALSALLDAGPYTYYTSTAHKADISLYGKGTWHAAPHWDVYLDMQYRHVRYALAGHNDKFLAQTDGTLLPQDLDILRHYDFFNPKAGITYHADAHTAYISTAVSHREPERNNFTDNGSYPAPQAESLYDTEAGYTFRHDRLHLSLNAYWMHYRNQFVQTGALSDIGELLTTNIRSSYRLGLELAATYSITPWLSLEANAAVSRNRLKDFTEHIEDWDAASGFTTQHYRRSTLAFSPTVTANAFADVHHKRWSATWHTAAVSRQYLDNTACKARSLAPYTFSDLRIGYRITLRTRHGLSTSRHPSLSPSKLPTELCHPSPVREGEKSLERLALSLVEESSPSLTGEGWRGAKHPRRGEAVISLLLTNIFNAHYSPTAWVYSAVSASSGYTPDHRFTQIGYFPTAGFTFIVSLTIKI